MKIINRFRNEMSIVQFKTYLNKTSSTRKKLKYVNNDVIKNKNEILTSLLKTKNNYHNKLNLFN